MKKSIIALAVAGAMTVPMIAQADATLFGEARYDITKEKDTKINSDLTRIRFGVKGEETMDNGLTAGYFLRFDATGDVASANAAAATATADAVTATNGTSSLTTQKAALYIAGDFGKVVMGQADSPAALVEDRTAYVSIRGDELGIVGTEWDHSGLQYETNDLNGLKFSIGTGNVDTDDARGENGYGAMVSYDTDSFGVTLGAGETAGDDGKTQTGISGEYKFGAGAVGLSLTDVEDTASYVAVSGKYSIDKLTLAAQVESKKLDSNDDKQRAVSVSASYALGGNAAVSIAAVSFNDHAEAAAKKDAVTVRYSVSF